MFTSKFLEIIFLQIFLCFNLFALEPEGLLTARILKISKSKRTILINRGQEDSVNIDDQAKFFLTSGIIARGVVVKVTPTRSIWSLYRVLHADQLIKNSVLKIKKTSAYKLTIDKTKELSDLEINKKIPLAPGADDQEDLKSMGKLNQIRRNKSSQTQRNNFEQGSMINLNSKRTFEIWGAFSFSSLSANYDLGANSNASGSGANFSSDYTIGFEKYFKTKGFFKKISLLAFLHKADRSALSATGQLISLSNFEFGAGLVYHFNSPFKVNKMNFFLSGAMGLGKSSDILNLSNSGTTSLSDFEITGASSSISLGGGIKYLLAYGFSFRTLIDLYTINESFAPPNSTSTDNFLKTTSGVRVQLGIGKRF